MRANRVLETCLYVDDLDAAERFYRDVIGLERESSVAGRHVFFRCGDSLVLLFQPDATRQPSGVVPTHGAEGPGHVAFAATPDELPAWREQFERHRVTIEMAVDWPQGGQSLYVRDPAGNSVEIATPVIWGLSNGP